MKEIREKLFCSDCKNCKIQAWKESTKIEKLENRGYMSELVTPAGRFFFVVRCSWTKDNLFAPLALVNCEGKEVVRGRDV